MQAWGWGLVGRGGGVSFKITYLLRDGRFFASSSLALHGGPSALPIPPSPPRKLLKPSTQKSERINRYLPRRAHAKLTGSCRMHAHMLVNRKCFQGV